MAAQSDSSLFLARIVLFPRLTLVVFAHQLDHFRVVNVLEVLALLLADKLFDRVVADQRRLEVFDAVLFQCRRQLVDRQLRRASVSAQWQRAAHAPD